MSQQDFTQGESNPRRREGDASLVRLEMGLANVVEKLADMSERLQVVQKHELAILNLQQTKEQQQKSIESLTDAIHNLTDKLGQLSIRFLTGIAWVAGASAVIFIMYVLLNSGWIHVGGAK